MPRPSTFSRIADRTSPRLIALVVAVIAAGCNSPSVTSSPSQSAVPVSPSAGGSPSAAPSAPPSSPSAVGAIGHKTGGADVVLRIEQGGGFVPIDFLATQAPGFTLFGDGVIVFQPKVDQFPQPDASGATKGVPWRTAKLDEDQVQDLLEFALGPGGLGGARDSYVEGGIADAPDTIFTVHAGGIDKTVVVNALSEEPMPGPDAPIRKAFFRLSSRLQDFDDGGRIPSDVYAPERFRAVLIEREAQAGLHPLTWPWPDLTLADFPTGPSDGSGPTTFPHRTMALDEVGLLKLDGLEGGLQGLAIEAPNGTLYGLILRPLLRDETA
ncbi:MAG: hypothetical protein ACJ761_07955 [Chloroflexota bacterium]